jgi:hypothetical protein
MILQVTVEGSAVEFRRLNSFEWVVLTMLKTFPGDTPSLVDTSTELAIGEPAFLSTALDNLCLIGAVKAKSDEIGQTDLKDFELTELGLKVLYEDGWENGNAEPFSESISLEWPSLRIHQHRGSEHHRQQKQAPPQIDAVQTKLAKETVEAWLNPNDSSPCWRVKDYFVSNVEA